MQKNLAQSLNNILEIIEKDCTDAGGEVYVNPSRLGCFKEETEYLGGRMNLAPFQAVIFAVIVESNAGGRCTVSKIAARLGMSYLQFLSYAKDLNALRDKGLIRIQNNNEIKVPASVINVIMNDKTFKAPKTSGLSNKVLVSRICSIVKGAYDEEYAPDQALEEIDILLEANPDTAYAKTCVKYKVVPGKMSPADMMLFHVFSYLYLKYESTVFEVGDAEGYIKDEEWMSCLREASETGELGIQITGAIEPANMDGLMAIGTYSFKEEVVGEAFPGTPFRRTDSIKTVDLNDLSDKPDKQMFYNEEEKGQIECLGSLLEEESLNKVYLKMKEKGLRTGFTCLFYGYPGTGKTETVYQLARKTGRKILAADVAKLRNCYIGETEKNVRRLFDQYRTSIEENDLAPILLLNEADAILGKRMEGAVKSVDRMENSVQNILLEEMENFGGIMIATTNLLGNLDPAFERRFLYKIRFNKPEIEQRRLIWKSQFPMLSDDDARSIAGEFNFSGGQIENVVRKMTIDSILTGKDGGLEQLRRYCGEESFNKSNVKRIGF